jgi:chromosome segregation ATPase
MTTSTSHVDGLEPGTLKRADDIANTNERSESLKQLRATTAKHLYPTEERERLAREEFHDRIDELIEQFENKLSTLTIDGALEDIVQLKNSELERLQDEVAAACDRENTLAGTIFDLESKIATLNEMIGLLNQDVERLRYRLHHSRSFKNLGRTFAVRVFEKLGFRKPPSL